MELVTVWDESDATVVAVTLCVGGHAGDERMLLQMHRFWSGTGDDDELWLRREGANRVTVQRPDYRAVVAETEARVRGECGALAGQGEWGRASEWLWGSWVGWFERMALRGLVAVLVLVLGVALAPVVAGWRVTQGWRDAATKGHERTRKGAGA